MVSVVLARVVFFLKGSARHARSLWGRLWAGWRLFWSRGVVYSVDYGSNIIVCIPEEISDDTSVVLSEFLKESIGPDGSFLVLSGSNISVVRFE